MKKIISLITILFVLLSVYGCSSSSTSNGGNSENNSTSGETNNNTDSSNTKQEEQKATLEEQEIFNQNDVVITATKLVDDSLWGQTINILIENNSASDVTVSANAMAVNGYMLTDLVYETVTAGAKSNATLYCMSTELENAGITAIEDVDVWFKLIDPDSYQTIYESSEPSTIKTSLSGTGATEPNFDGQEVYNNNGVVVKVAYTDENSFWGRSLLFYVENNSGQNIVISSADTSINGFMISGYYYADVKDGYKSFDDMTIFDSDLEDNNIESIESIKFKLTCYDSDSYRSIFESDYIEISTK